MKRAILFFFVLAAMAIAEDFRWIGVIVPDGEWTKDYDRYIVVEHNLAAPTGWTWGRTFGSGLLPPGLSLDYANDVQSGYGLISGIIPDLTGSGTIVYTFTVFVREDGGDYDEQELSITVDEPTSP